MYTPQIYVLRWHKPGLTIYWEKYDHKKHRDDIGLFLDFDTSKAICIHWAIEIANSKADVLQKADAKHLCEKIWPHMKKSTRLQIKHLEKIRFCEA